MDLHRPSTGGITARSWRRAIGAAACASLGSILLAGAAMAQPVIQTVAGGGPDAVAARAVTFASMPAVAVDRSGVVFVADGAGRVYRIGRGGGIVPYAGNDSSPAYLGDGMPARSASLTTVNGLVLDGAGNLFLSDAQAVRRVDAATASITTVLGSASQARGLALDAAGNLFVADGPGFRVFRIDAVTHVATIVAGTGTSGFSGDGGPATGAALNNPWDVAVDRAGNLFIADRNNNRIRRVDAATGIISTVVGTGVAGFGGDGGAATAALLSSPRGLGLDRAGNLFIADRNNGRVRRVDASTGVITTVAGSGAGGFAGDGGPAAGAAMGPVKVAFDVSDNMLIADERNRRIRKVTALSGLIETIAGNGVVDVGLLPQAGFPATRAKLGPTGTGQVGIGFDAAGAMHLANGGLVRRLDPVTQRLSVVAGGGPLSPPADEGMPATSATVNCTDVSFDAAGNMIVDNRLTDTIRRVDGASGAISTVAGQYNVCCACSGDAGLATNANFNEVDAVIADTGGNLFVADFYCPGRRIDAATGIIAPIPFTAGQDVCHDQGSMQPEDFAFDASGRLLISDVQCNRVRRLDLSTGMITDVAGSHSAPGFAGDGGPAIDAMFRNPANVAVDLAGNIYLSDSGNNRVRRVDAATGVISTVAGNGAASFTGDGGPATSASIDSPWDLEVDAAGDVYVAADNRVRKIFMSCHDNDADGVSNCQLDCDDSNTAAWNPPGEVGGLMLRHDLGSGTTSLQWNPPSQPGGTTLSYDVIRTGDPSDLLAGASCQATGTPLTTLDDAGDPATGHAFYYLVRADNGCPTEPGTWGDDAFGIPRIGRTCP